MKNYKLLIAYIILCDIKEALEHVKKYVLPESAFFNAFHEEGRRFSSSFYLCLIWIQVLKHALQNPNEAAENLKNHPFFKKFVSRLSTDVYTDGLCCSLESICIDSPVKQPSEKRKLSEIFLEENSSNAENASTRSRKAWDTSSEDSAPETTTIYIAKSSPKKKDKKAEENQKAVSL